MKYTIFLLVCFFISVNSLDSLLFSQQIRPNDSISDRNENSNPKLKVSNLLNNVISNNSQRDDTTKTEKPKSWWEALLDFNFWGKLSGPGPFLGLGGEYPVFVSKNFLAVFVGASFSNSLDNTLKYHKTIQRTEYIHKYGQITDTAIIGVDSCIQCNKSKSVQMVSFNLNAQYHIPRSRFDLILGGGIHTFFGEAFKSFSRISGTLGAKWHVLNYIHLGLIVNVFEQFKPGKFGAVEGKDEAGSVEFIPGAFISIGLH